MKGCRWEDKRFSFSVSEHSGSDVCDNCGEDLDTLRKHNGRRLCKRCFDCIPTLNTVGAGMFNTSKDKLWEFTSYHVTGKPVHISSKRQWKKLLKENNKHDDTSLRDLHTINKNHNRNTNEKNKRETRKMLETVYREVRRGRWTER